MSHAHIRHDKNCLNCGATVTDRYCSQCGQENTEPRETFGHLIRHFFDDVTHYDSHVFTSLKDLIIRPGFLTRQYNVGKRASYLNPIRMYVFISAVFFLTFFSINKESENKKETTTVKQDVNLYRQHLADSLTVLTEAKGTLTADDKIRNGVYTSLAAKLDTPTTKAKTGTTATVAFNNHGELILTAEEYKYKTFAEYEADQLKLPVNKRDGNTDRYLARRVIKLLSDNGNQGKAVITVNLEHDIPKIMFLLLPLFALFVRFFYSRKKFLYSQHIIFSLHFHSFLFLILFVLCLVSLMNPSLHGWLVIAGMFDLGMFIYLTLALSNAYQEKLWLSALKALGVSLLYGFSLMIVNILLILVVFILV